MVERVVADIDEIMTTLTSIPGVARPFIAAQWSPHLDRVEISPMTLASIIAGGETLNVGFTSDANDTELVGTWREIEVQRRTARLNCERSAS